MVLAQAIVPAGAAPTIGGTITLSGGNTVTGLIFDVPSADALVGSGISNITVADSTFLVGNTSHASFTNIAGTATFDSKTFEATDFNQDFLNITNTDTDCTVTINENSFRGSDGRAPRP